MTVEITYEPSHLGDARTQLSVSSSLGGEYICPLFGHCIAPRPQGPITIRPGAPACVPFKNVFSSSTTFNFAVDNPAFSVKASEVIPSKKAIQILVSFKPPGTADGAKGEKALAAHAAAANTFMSNGSTKVGKLTVTSLASSQVVWVYYLKLSS